MYVFVDILTGKKMSLVKLAIMDLIQWSVRSYNRRGGDGELRWMWVILFLASCEHHYIRVHINLVQHSSNNISIFKTPILKGDMFCDEFQQLKPLALEALSKKGSVDNPHYLGGRGHEIVNYLIQYLLLYRIRWLEKLISFKIPYNPLLSAIKQRLQHP